MEIQNISATNSLQGTSGLAPNKEVTKEAFLKLLITQLQNQDPLNPMENYEFTAQLATFNILDQLIAMNGRLDSMQSQQAAASQIGAVSLIGKEVIVDGNRVIPREAGSTPVYFRLESNAARGTVQIKDSSGALMRSVEFGSQSAGEQKVLWDGKDNLGRSVPPGVYTYEINALDSRGNQIRAKTETRGIVSSVNVAGNHPTINIGSLEVPLSDIMSVR
ncbi:MAG: hypothetical protein HY695_21245 [Deltaproteobacteria bacterium]|nr:hypothetical protein [Deltaproteobacteria bacterium]